MSTAIVLTQSATKNVATVLHVPSRRSAHGTSTAISTMLVHTNPGWGCKSCEVGRRQSSRWRRSRQARPKRRRSAMNVRRLMAVAVMNQVTSAARANEKG